MAHAENTVIIKRPISDVYAFIADPLNELKWRKGIQSIALKSGIAGTVGAIYSQTLTGPGGRPIKGDFEITRAEPGSLVAFQVIAGPARPTGAFHLAEVLSGTRVRFELDLQPKGLMKLIDRLITRTMWAEVAQLNSLKTAVGSH
ncbi:SRPBCC family protein [Arthrobacter sp. MMS24-S77]